MILETDLIENLLHFQVHPNSIMNIQDFSDEILLHIFNSLDGNSLFLCGRISKRFRKITKEKSLWLNFKIWPVNASQYHYRIPTELIPFLVKHGCNYLDVTLCRHSINEEEIRLPKQNNLNQLRLSYCDERQDSMASLTSAYKVFRSLIANSCSLSKLAIEGIQSHQLFS